jgi:hypothetical protein
MSPSLDRRGLHAPDQRFAAAEVVAAQAVSDRLPSTGTPTVVAALHKS